MLKNGAKWSESICGVGVAFICGYLWVLLYSMCTVCIFVSVTVQYVQCLYICECYCTVCAVFVYLWVLLYSMRSVCIFVRVTVQYVQCLYICECYCAVCAVFVYLWVLLYSMCNVCILVSVTVQYVQCLYTCECYCTVCAVFAYLWVLLYSMYTVCIFVLKLSVLCPSSFVMLQSVWSYLFYSWFTVSCFLSTVCSAICIVSPYAHCCSCRCVLPPGGNPTAINI
jgi:hypothetical protein